MNSAPSLNELHPATHTPNPQAAALQNEIVIIHQTQHQVLTALSQAEEVPSPSARRPVDAPLIEQTLRIKRPADRGQLRVLFSLGMIAGVMVTLLVGSLAARSRVAPLPAAPENIPQPALVSTARQVDTYPIPPLRLATPARVKTSLRKTESRPMRVSGKIGVGE